jgi:hypothetical protein
MTMIASRRQMLAWVGQGMLAASVGPSLARDLGLAPFLRGGFGGDDELDFGELEPLVAFMQETAPDQLIPTLVGKLRAGTELRTLISAGALANARTFGGEDYAGYHCAMALVPALEMAAQLPAAERPLPVLKVLHRNTSRIQACGGRRREVLRRITADPEAGDGVALRALVRAREVAGAERALAAIVGEDPAAGYEQLQLVVQDDVNVHRVVLAFRAWDLMRLCGRQHAHTLLRQSLRFCVAEEKQALGGPGARLRTLLPELLERHEFAGWRPGSRAGDDGWLQQLAQTVFGASRDDAAGAVAQALAEGFATEDVGEAISLAANRLLRSDPGRRDDRDPTRPRGSVHGASVGVHAQDAAHAWRAIARVTSARTAAASLIVAAYHTAGQSQHVDGDVLPLPHDREDLDRDDPAVLLAGTRRCIEAGDQLGASAFLARYGELGHPSRPAFDLLLGFAVAQDGALHAEKYYRTAEQEYGSTRPSRRNDHLVALGRVTASGHGWVAPGVEQASQLLRG